MGTSLAGQLWYPVLQHFLPVPVVAELLLNFLFLVFQLGRTFQLLLSTPFLILNHLLNF